MEEKILYRRWTKEEDEKLACLWGVKPLDKIAKLLNRPPRPVHDRAKLLRLDENNGFVHYTVIAERFGLSTCTMRRIIEEKNVPKMAKTFYGKTEYSTIRVDETMALIAVEEWLTTEVVGNAERIRGITKGTLIKWLALDGHIKPLEKKKGHWRLPTSVIEAVIEKYSKQETIADAARRHHMDEKTLKRLLKQAGIEPEASEKRRVWRLDPKVIDAAISNPKVELVACAARRLGVAPLRLRMWLLRAGHQAPPRRHRWYIDKTIAEQVVAENRKHRNSARAAA